MAWQDRLKEIAVLGGLLLGGCDVLHRRCLNCIPDPCAGLPNQSECDAQVACEDEGGFWTGPDFERARQDVDAGTGGRCVFGYGDAAVPDAAVPDATIYDGGGYYADGHPSQP